MAVDIRMLKNVTLFQGLSSPQLVRVASLCHERRFERSEELFQTGDPGDCLYLIDHGWVKVTRLSSDGREKTLTILGEGDCLGEMALLDGEPRSAAARALTSCATLCLERARFRELLDDSPSLAVNLLSVLTARLREANAQIEELTFQDARGKVAAALLQLRRSRGIAVSSGIHIPLKLTHQELASLAGTTRETTSRVLAEFFDNGTIDLHDGHFVITRQEALDLLSTGRP